ncbi:unnamed protein product [Prunus armeniaca]|uniref:Uncharacterized protein n=1 Tax=Prunus armeniaca TaxID=36596 RepID=A0A6J5U8X8_PRUAR|nr:unnamed protein product [Prunus armeniaca]
MARGLDHQFEKGIEKVCFGVGHHQLHLNEPGCVEGEHRHVREEEEEEEAKDDDAARFLFAIRARMHAMCSISMSTSMFDN